MVNPKCRQVSKEFFQTMKEHHRNEELLFSIDEGKVESFLKQKNLTPVEHLRKEEIESAFLVDDNGALIGQIPGHFRFVQAASKHQ